MKIKFKTQNHNCILNMSHSRTTKTYKIISLFFIVAALIFSQPRIYAQSAILDPNKDTMDKANSWLKKGQHQKALELYKSLLDKFPEGSEQYNKLIYNMAQALSQGKQYKQSEYLNQKALSSKNNKLQAQVLNNQGVNFARQGKMKEAQSSFLQALKMDADNGRIKRNLERLQNQQQKKQDQNKNQQNGQDNQDSQEQDDQNQQNQNDDQQKKQDQNQGNQQQNQKQQSAQQDQQQAGDEQKSGSEQTVDQQAVSKAEDLIKQNSKRRINRMMGRNKNKRSKNPW